MLFHKKDIVIILYINKFHSTQITGKYSHKPLFAFNLSHEVYETTVYPKMLHHMWKFPEEKGTFTYDGHDASLLVGILDSH